MRIQSNCLHQSSRECICPHLQRSSG